jgi:hypothetical protein
MENLETTPMRPRGVGLPLLLVLVGLGLVGGAAAYVYHSLATPREPTPSPSLHLPGAGTNGQVQTFCSTCHLYPPEECLPRDAWKDEIERAYRFFVDSGLTRTPPTMEQAIQYYEGGAPLELPAAVFEAAKTPLPFAFEKTHVPALPAAEPPAVSNVNLVHLFDERRLDVLACDMRRGQVLLYRPCEPSPTWRVLANVPNPAHAEVIDLDGDGIKDILVANLGSMKPTDDLCGSVVWLRGNRDGTFTPYTLLDGVGRVADVQAGNFRKTGKLDLVVAVFGWNKTGEIRFLENQTADWSQPKFVSLTLDNRHGTIHVPVVDLNDDGNLDFVALISQEHEAIVAFLGDGKGNFTPKELYRGPHPAYGSTGIQLVDLNGDGKVDILYTNGESFDKPHVLRPYHGVQWLENKGDLKFAHHAITPLYGAHRAVAADFTGTGRMDIVAVSFLPAKSFPQRAEKNLDSVIYLEQIAPGRYARHSLETATCDHVTCAAGDIFGGGRVDFVTGNFSTSGGSDLGITIWKNPRR